MSSAGLTAYVPRLRPLLARSSLTGRYHNVIMWHAINFLPWLRRRLLKEWRKLVEQGDPTATAATAATVVLTAEVVS